ncbi:adenomatous polyposis coli protein [Biomphalaria glabrata]|nr:adenomatous polyposis coli protein-like [Biomphalaria glabrata]
MSQSSYDQLLKQVASLKCENVHLRRELKDNSSHLTKLENDTSNMKDVLSHIQVTLGATDDQDDFCQETGAEHFIGQFYFKINKEILLRI